jgi:hypothetical protein
MGGNQEFVVGVEGSQSTKVHAGCQEISPALQRKDGRNEVLAELEIIQATIVFDWKKRKVLHEDTSKNPTPSSVRHALRIVNLHPRHATAGRIALEDETAQPFLFLLQQALPSPKQHAIGMVLAVSHRP